MNLEEKKPKRGQNMSFRSFLLIEKKNLFSYR